MIQYQKYLLRLCPYTLLQASSKISSFNGKGVYKYKDGKWYVYKEEDYSNLSFGSKSEADDYIKKHLSPAGRFLVKYYHNGLENGLVDFSKKDSNFDLVKKYGLKKYEVPAILKQGEAVMNQEQIKNLGEALRAIPTAATLYTTPDYTKMLSSLKTNNTPVMVTQSVNITLKSLEWISLITVMMVRVNYIHQNKLQRFICHRK